MKLDSLKKCKNIIMGKEETTVEDIIIGVLLSFISLQFAYALDIWREDMTNLMPIVYGLGISSALIIFVVLPLLIFKTQNKNSNKKLDMQLLLQEVKIAMLERTGNSIVNLLTAQGLVILNVKDAVEAASTVTALSALLKEMVGLEAHIQKLGILGVEKLKDMMISEEERLKAVVELEVAEILPEPKEVKKPGGKVL